MARLNKLQQDIENIFDSIIVSDVAIVEDVTLNQRFLDEINGQYKLIGLYIGKNFKIYIDDESVVKVWFDKVTSSKYIYDSYRFKLIHNNIIGEVQLLCYFDNVNDMPSMIFEFKEL